MRTMKALPFLLLLLLLSLRPAAAQLTDGDGDGVEDGQDLCPAQDASLFDRDGDGCVDPTTGARHVEYWDPTDLPLSFVIHQAGAPLINDGSDFTAIQAGYAAWTLVSGVELSAVYGGTTAQAGGDGLDGIHLVSFQDPDFAALYGTSVLAVGVTTSFTVPTFHDGRWVRPGQIVDADMLFNPNRSFSTGTAGTGVDLESVATHEAGHLYGISHSAIETATMFPALPPGQDARSLETDDETMIFMAYPDTTALATATVLEGMVRDGASGLPLPGAALFAITEATGDTSACQFSLPDGSYRFAGLPEGSYFLAVHPLDGGQAIKGVTPGYINSLVDSTAVTLFVPEYWDAAESAHDISTDKTALVLAAGSPLSGVDIDTNVDATAPQLVEITPAADQSGVRIDALVLLGYDEGIEFSSIQTRLHFAKVADTGLEPLGGSLLSLPGDRVLVFDPAGALDYASEYELTIDAGVTDGYGNPTPDPLTFRFVTEPEPPVAITSLSPVKGVVGALLVINGVGFSELPLDNQVSFGPTPATVENASPTQLVVRVPSLSAGDISISVTEGGETSNSELFTVLSSTETVRGNAMDAVQLSGTPVALALLPDESFAYVATGLGVEVVCLAPSQPDFGSVVAAVALPGGAEAVAATPDGRRVYAVSRAPAAFHVIDSDYVDLDNRSALFNQVLDSVPMEEEPLGLAVDPAGRCAYIPTASGSVEVWDVLRAVIGNQTVSSLTLHRQVGQIPTSGASLEGSLAFDPTGARVLVVASAGSVLVHATEGERPLLAEIPAGLDPRDVTVDALGQRAYLSDATGGVAVLDLPGLAPLITVSTAGSLRGVALSAAGGVCYAVDRENDQLDLIDLSPGSVGYLSVAGTVPTGGNPAELAVSADGLFVYTLEQTERRLGVVAIGYGPVVRTVSPPRVRPGDVVVIGGEGFPPLTVGQQLFIEYPGVYFDDVLVNAVRATTTQVEVVVPAGYAGGTIRVRDLGAPPSPGLPEDPFSNPLTLPVLPGDPPFQALGFASPLSADYGYDWGIGVHNVVEASPRGDLVLLTRNGSELVFLDARPSSATFQQPLAFLDTNLGTLYDLVFTPDGKRAFATGLGGASADIVDTDLLSPTFGTRLGEVDMSQFPEGSPERMAVDPGGEQLAILNSDGNVLFFDLRPGANQYRLADVNTALAGSALTDLRMHPGGRALYISEAQGQGGLLHILRMDPALGGYRGLVASYAVPNSIHALEMDPDGSRLFLSTANIVGVDSYLLQEFSVPSLDYPDSLGARTVAAVVDDVATLAAGGLRIAPNGDRLYVDTVAELVVYDVTQQPTPEEMFRLSVNGTGQPLGYDIVPDGGRMYTASFADTHPRVIVASRSELLSATGRDQTGVAGQPLPAPVRVRVLNGDLSPTAGMSVFVQVVAGGGTLENGTQQQVYLTDGQGYADIHWTLGPEITPVPAPASPTHRLRIDVVNTGGLDVEATAVADPSSLPLQLVQVLPVTNAAGISPGTAVQASFSREVDPSSIGPTSFFLHPQGSPTSVPVAYGFSDGNRKVSMTPLAPLEYSTVYVVEATTDILDGDGGLLTASSSTVFIVQDPPPLSLDAVSPPAAVVGTPVVISGAGFDAAHPTANLVHFGGGVTAAALSAGVDFVQVLVPLGAQSGEVQVEANAQLSGALSFNVLVPTDQPLDEIVAEVGTGATTRGIAITPDGLRAYSIADEANEVLPLDLQTFTTDAPIAVGNQPVAIDIEPTGSRAYVANYASGTVSVIDLSTDMLSETIVVGGNPVDLLVAPDGQRIYVINLTDQTVDVIDGNEASGTYHGVVAKVPRDTGTTQGAAISPDGTVLYLGTSDGFLIFSLDPNSFGVTTKVTTGSTTKAAAITPDGSLLLLVTTDGEVLVVDVSPGGSNAVVAKVPAGNGTTQGAAISPDGTLLYLIQEDSDEILVVQITIVGSVSVVEDYDAALSLRVEFRLLDSIQAGSDPVLVAFDPTGTGLTLVGNAGSAPRLTVLNTSALPFGQLEADLTVTPRTLNLQSKGRWVSALIALPPPASVRDIDVASVRLQGQIPAEADRVTYEDVDGDGFDEVEFKFCRAAFQEILPQGEYVPVEVGGELPPIARSFVGRDTIRTLRPTVLHPKGGELFPQGQWIVVQWSSPQGVRVSRVDVDWTADDGESWQPIVTGAPDTGAVPWELPQLFTERARVLVTLYDEEGVDLGMGMSAGTFSILEPAVPVAMGEVELRSEGAQGLLRWEVAESADLEGFQVLRSSSEEGPFLPLTDAPIVALDPEGTRYEFRDGGLEGNRNYWYLLEEVRDGRSKGFSHGPYKLSVVLRSSLAQNVPNSFNPRTTIRFSIAETGPTRLVVYNLAGRQVRVLVNGLLKADNYAVEWDGTDDRGESVASGVYLYRLETTRFAQSRKMVLVR